MDWTSTSITTDAAAFSRGAEQARRLVVSVRPLRGDTLDAAILRGVDQKLDRLAGEDPSVALAPPPAESAFYDKLEARVYHLRWLGYPGLALDLCELPPSTDAETSAAPGNSAAPAHGDGRRSEPAEQRSLLLGPHDSDVLRTLIAATERLSLQIRLAPDYLQAHGYDAPVPVSTWLSRAGSEADAHGWSSETAEEDLIDIPIDAFDPDEEAPREGATHDFPDTDSSGHGSIDTAFTGAEEAPTVEHEHDWAPTTDDRPSAAPRAARAPLAGWARARATTHFDTAAAPSLDLAHCAERLRRMTTGRPAEVEQTFLDAYIPLKQAESSGDPSAEWRRVSHEWAESFSAGYAAVVSRLGVASRELMTTRRLEPLAGAWLRRFRARRIDVLVLEGLTAVHADEVWQLVAQTLPAPVSCVERRLIWRMPSSPEDLLARASQRPAAAGGYNGWLPVDKGRPRVLRWCEGAQQADAPASPLDVQLARYLSQPRRDALVLALGVPAAAAHSPRRGRPGALQDLVPEQVLLPASLWLPAQDGQVAADGADAPRPDLATPVNRERLSNSPALP